jgi:TonB family protein
LVTGAFPLSAAPQLVSDAPGVAVDVGGAQLMHRSGVEYPVDAIAKGVQGTVVAQVKLDANGAVTDASIVSGPDELRKAVLQSVLDWHFGKDAGATRQVSVTFELPKEGAQGGVAGGVIGGIVGGVTGGVGVGVGAGAGAAAHGTAHVSEEDQRKILKDLYARMPSPFANRVIKSIVVSEISEQAKADLMAGLPIHAGDTLTEDAMIDVNMAVRKVDMRLGVAVFPDKDAVVLQIAPQGSPEFGVSPIGGSAGIQPAPPVALEDGTAGAERLRVSGNVQALQLISHVEPVYPPLAKQAQIQGTVVFSALIDKDGKVRDLKVVRGHPLLVQAALDAVKKWVYKPTTINGEPVEVRTDISINFTLPPPDKAETPTRIKVGGNVQAANLVTQVRPNYPPEAKQAGIQGTVKLQVILDKDGRVQDVKVVSGDPLLAAAAVDAVKNWVYRPTLLNGEPVEVQTMIDVNFTLQ